MLSIVTSLLGNTLVHVQVVPSSSIDCPLSSKKNFMKSLVKYPYHRGYLEIPEGWDLQITIV